MSEEIKPMERYFASKLPFKQLCRIAEVPEGGYAEGEIIISMASPFWCGVPYGGTQVEEEKNEGVLYMVKGRPDRVNEAMGRLKAENIMEVPAESAGKQVRLQQMGKYMANVKERTESPGINRDIKRRGRGGRGRRK